ncbi:MAG: hypothetical protein ACJ72N_16880 [Labedaea sp.]
MSNNTDELAGMTIRLLGGWADQLAITERVSKADQVLRYHALERSRPIRGNAFAENVKGHRFNGFPDIDAYHPRDSLLTQVDQNNHSHTIIGSSDSMPFDRTQAALRRYCRYF